MQAMSHADCCRFWINGATLGHQCNGFFYNCLAHENPRKLWVGNWFARIFGKVVFLEGEGVGVATSFGR